MQFFVDYFWLVESAFFLVVALTCHLVFRSLFKRLYPKFCESRTIWDDTLLFSAYKPVLILLWVVVVSYCAQVVSAHFGWEIPRLGAARKIGMILAAVWFCWRFIGMSEKRLVDRATKKGRDIDPTTLNGICQVLRAAALIVGLLFFLTYMGIPTSGVVAFGGIGGIVVGMAAKDLLGNFFGSLMIFFDRPFKVGDWVASPDRSIEGTVEHIGWRLTRIRTFEKRPLYVPNGIFTSIAIETPSRMTHRRIKTLVGIRYQDAHKMEQVVADVETMLHEHPDIDTSQLCFVKFCEFGPYALNFIIYTLTKQTGFVAFHAVQQDIFLKVLKIIADNGAQLAFPTSTIEIPAGIPPTPYTTPLSVNSIQPQHQ